MAKVIGTYERDIEEFRLIPSGGGRFEFAVNGELLFSKEATGRHANEDELLDLVSEYLAENPQ